VLKALAVSDLVVVRHIDVEFGPGLTVLSGETGAGKSILIEALGLALGERADSRLVRPGCDRAVVTAVFDLSPGEPAAELLAAQGLDSDGECVLRRVVQRDGGSRAFCNANPIAVQALRELGACLVDIHGQHASQRLLQRDQQRMLLDDYGALSALVTATRDCHQRWKAAEQRVQELERLQGDRDRNALVRYQLAELTAAGVGGEDLAALEARHRDLAHGAANLEQCEALAILLGADEDSALARLRAALARARTLAKRATAARDLPQLVDQATVLTEEALASVERTRSAVEIDPERLARLDERLAALHALARKHHVTVADLPALETRLSGELRTFETALATLEDLERARAAARGEYATSAQALSAARTQSAARLEVEIGARLLELGLPHARFAAELSAQPEQAPQAHGQDRVDFLVATNPEQALAPLNKVASGGELSRVGLALHAASSTRVPVVVYDEVDTGIGGVTANIVGRTLRQVARHCQVICITHSPQVASAGDQHVMVTKSVRDGMTETELVALTGAAREREIARMLGAAQATKASVAHARDLLADARNG